MNGLFDEEIADPDRMWVPYCYLPPPLNWLHIEIWRREWAGPRIVSQAEIPPWLNVDGLYWRRV